MADKRREPTRTEVSAPGADGERAEMLAAQVCITLVKNAGTMDVDISFSFSSVWAGVNALSNLTGEFARRIGVPERKLLLLLIKGAEGEEVQEA